MILLIMLGLLVIPVETIERLMLEATLSDRTSDTLDDTPLDVQTDEPVEPAEEIVFSSDLPEVRDPLASAPEVTVVPDAVTAADAMETPAIGLALTGRDEGMKKALLSVYGGTGATERAVAEGLKWLARQQRRDGSWSLKGPYSGGAYDENHLAATAMALLAFQGAGHTHMNRKDDPYQQVVSRGLSAMLTQLASDGSFTYEGPNHHRLYTHAQCTIALCELYGMTRDEKLQEPAQRAVNYCLAIQDRAGGWRYYPGTDSDTSVTGWFLMALQSARMAYLVVPEAHLRRIEYFLDSVSVDGGSQYLYRPGDRGGLAMTAEGLLCRQYLGWKRNDPRLLQGVGYLLDNLPDWNSRNVYYWYYATQVCHHMEGEIWNRWNRVMRQLLPEKQTRSGRERGSWDPAGDQWGPHGGRLYVTCLSIYMLEVYYRHLAIYQHQEGPLPEERSAAIR
jgi:hypothetical protein